MNFEASKTCLALAAILILFLIPSTSPAETVKTYLVSVGESGGESVGYTCREDQICDIKFLIGYTDIIVVSLQFIDDNAYILFKRGEDYLFIGANHLFGQKYLSMDLADMNCQKQKITLSRKPSTLDDSMTPRKNWTGKALITICPKNNAK